MDDGKELLNRAAKGDREAHDELFGLVHRVLRQIARGQLRKYGRGATSQTTSLVDECYIKLMGNGDVTWESLSQFYKLAHTVLRDVAVDHKRKREAQARGGGRTFVCLDTAGEVRDDDSSPIERIEREDALQGALTELAAYDEGLALIVHMQHFEGMTFAQVSEVLGVPLSTAKSRSQLALTKLYQGLKRRGFDA
jgi:RNA polymerase sigma factor (TIGR02999 family)